jgi:hypothetical protein
MAPEESKPRPPLDQGYALTMLSCDAPPAICAGCGEKRLIYPAHYFAFTGLSVRDRCKGCHEKAAAERGGNIFVKSAGTSLPRVWAKDRRRDAPPSLEKAHQARRQRAK